jgi:hypothetical protein
MDSPWAIPCGHDSGLDPVQDGLQDQDEQGACNLVRLHDSSADILMKHHFLNTLATFKKIFVNFHSEH